jgi:Protein of unknown function (DUF3499)
VATLTFVYSDSTAVVGPLATTREPHSWDLCVGHAGRITAPRGWDLVRHAGSLSSEPTHPDEDDLVALADAVREGGPAGGVLPAAAAQGGTSGAPLNGYRGFEGYTDPRLHHAGAHATSHATSHATAPSSGMLAPSEHRSGRRRGHLRVLPDPAD